MGLDPELTRELGPLVLSALATVAGLQYYLRVPFIDCVTYINKTLLTKQQLVQDRTGTGIHSAVVCATGMAVVLSSRAYLVSKYKVVYIPAILRRWVSHHAGTDVSRIKLFTVTYSSNLVREVRSRFSLTKN